MKDQVQAGAVPTVEGVVFRDPPTGKRQLEKLRKRLSPQSFGALLPVLRASPDADTTVVMLWRMLDAEPELGAGSGPNETRTLQYACEVFAHSQWLGEALLRNRDLLPRLTSARALGRWRSREDYREEFGRFCARSSAGELAHQLARFRKREYVRILLRDVLRIARIGEITAEISALSDALLEEAAARVHAELRERYGAPQSLDQHGRYSDARFAVVSLGKLGGNELNYSSDVDLLFLYDGGEAPPEARLSNREYFIELAQKTTELLTQATPEGQVFRIDLRLRPQGREGELAVGVARAIAYYAGTAEDWELQAMIKARHSAGDEALTKAFVRGIARYVYRPDVNFAAVKTALQARERIDRQRRSPLRREAGSKAIDVKLGRGGIRDIEFLVQCLQRVYGGKEPWLRSRGTLFALQKLHDKEHISSKDFHTLSKAYEVLRETEHRLQLRHGQQIHRLPAASEEVEVLARCLDRGETDENTAQEFRSNVALLMGQISEIYERVVYSEQRANASGAQGRGESAEHDSAGMAYGESKGLLAVDAPGLLERLNRAELSSRGRQNLERFLDSVSASPERYRALLQGEVAMDAAVKVFESSEYLSAILIRHPEDLSWLEPGAVTAQDALERFSDVSDATMLRQHYRRAMLMRNAQEMLAPERIWELLRSNSEIADCAVRQALALTNAPEELCVIALGRLGSEEFDVLSDADLLFVADDSADRDSCRWAVERLVETLAAYTRDGVIVSVDARLRPHGSVGELVTTPSRLAQYFAGEAEPWEALTYLRMRAIAGSLEVAANAIETVRSATRAMAQTQGFMAGLKTVRSRLEASERSPNFKTGAGGTYDIDFLVGSLQCQNGLFEARNLSDRIELVRQSGLMSEELAGVLQRNGAFLREVEHRVRLVTGQSAKWVPANEQAHQQVAAQINRAGASPQPLDELLRDALAQNSQAYKKYLFD